MPSIPGGKLRTLETTLYICPGISLVALVTLIPTVCRLREVLEEGGVVGGHRENGTKSMSLDALPPTLSLPMKPETRPLPRDTSEQRKWDAL